MKTLSNECFFSRVESEISEGRNVRFRVKGNSMLPFLRSGKDIVVLHPCRGEALKRGDVVLFHYKGKHVLHRIIRKRGHFLILQGDGVCGFHEECVTDDVIGIVKQIQYRSGKMVSVSSFRWQMKSELWCRLGRCRGIVLRMLYRGELFLSGRSMTHS